MIKTEAEYQEIQKRLEKDLEFIKAQRERLEEMKLKPDEVERAMEPAYSFHEQLKDEVQWYEKVKRRDFGIIQDLTGLGPLLIALRIANGISQTELAQRLDVDVSQISRDEGNEYHGISIDRAQRVLNALGEKLVTHVQDKLVVA